VSFNPPVLRIKFILAIVWLSSLEPLSFCPRHLTAFFALPKFCFGSRFRAFSLAVRFYQEWPQSGSLVRRLASHFAWP
jgi:hypothetical protein